jgi:diguanylate cyclase (GGDEF)-like protein/PAS domain S-box-containing protein
MDDGKKPYLFFSESNQQIEEVLQDSEERFHTLLESANDAVFIMDEDRFYGCNAHTLTMFECSKEQIIGMQPWRFSPEYQFDGTPSSDKARQYIHSAVSGMPQRFEWIHRTYQGRDFETEVTLTRMYLTGNTRLLAIVRDISERKRIEKALHESEEKYRLLFEESNDATFITTLAGEFVDSNRALLILFGYTREEMSRVRSEDTYYHPGDRERFKQAIATFGSVRDFDVKLKKRDGSVIDCLVTATRRFAQDGTVIGYQGVLRDISEKKRMEESLRRSEDTYRAIFETTGAATIIVEDDTAISMANSEFEKLSGYTRQEIEENRIGITDIVAPEDIRKLIEFHRLRRIHPGAAPRNYEFLGKDRYGNPKNILMTIGLIPGTSRSVASLLDITGRKQIEKNLQAAFKTTRDIIENAPIGVYVLNARGRVDYVNPEMLRISGATRDQFLGLNMMRIPEYRKTGITEKIRKGFKGERFRVDSVTLTPRFVKKPSIRNVIGIPFEEGGEKKLLMFVEDITERKHHEEKLAHIATHDSLTGLPNRLLFNDRLHLAMAYAHRHEQKLAVIVFDLDRFKEVNDSLGHKVGDILLRRVGTRLSKVLRKSDTLARMGGDEFLLLSPDISRPEDTEPVAEKILKSLRKPFRVDGHRLNISASIGIAVYPDDGKDIDTLIRHADAAMYQIKQKGRNGYQRYGADHPINPSTD